MKKSLNVIDSKIINCFGVPLREMVSYHKKHKKNLCY